MLIGDFILKEDMLLQIFSGDTRGDNFEKGQRVLNNDLISSFDITSRDDVIQIDGRVISENLFNEYHTRIQLQTGKLGILSTYCSCADFEKNASGKKNYACKHLVATFYRSAGELSRHPLLGTKKNEDNGILKSSNNLLSMLLGDGRDKREIRIDVYLNRDKWTHKLSAEFKIGLREAGSANMYVLKDIKQFLTAYYNEIPIDYSRSFMFYSEIQRLSLKDRRLVDFMETLRTLEGRNRLTGSGKEKLLDGKYIFIPEYLTREFIEIIAKHRVYLNQGFFDRAVETEILMKSPEVDFDLSCIDNSYMLRSRLGMPLSLGQRNDVLIYGTTIFLPDYEFSYRIGPYLKIFNQAKAVTFPIEQEDIILRRLIPELQLLTPEITLSKSIRDKIVKEIPAFSFYFDRLGMDISLLVKVRYGIYEFNIFEDITEKVIYRDTRREQQIISLLGSLGFEEVDHRFYFIKDDDYIFRFFKSEISKLQEIGEVYYSDNFKGIKYIGTRGISGNISAGKYDYFEMNFKIGDISSDETVKILRAFRDNRKYYKLKNGAYLDLEELELKQFLKLLALVDAEESEDNHVRISKGKGALIDEYLEENNIRYLSGREELQEISSRLKSIKELKLETPEGLNANLREYQKVGYSWLRTLDYLGLGGILGDEMGLGKTLQAICLLAANKGSKALLVVPTSLIYNWISEFQRFAREFLLSL